MVIVCQVHHLRTGKKEETLSAIKYGPFGDFSAVVKLHVNIMAENENEEVEVPLLGYLVAVEFNIRWQHLILISLSAMLICIDETVESCRNVALSGHGCP